MSNQSRTTCLLTDQPGEGMAVTDEDGELVSQSRYLPFGLVRGDLEEAITETDYGYTGQRNLDAQENTYLLGLMDYKARFYDPYLYRFTQPDTIIPDLTNPQAWNRYSYGLNNPSRFTDPSGHIPRECRTGELDPHLPICQPGGSGGSQNPSVPTIPPDPTSNMGDEDEPVYDGQAAAEWAAEHWDVYVSGCASSCTAFVSMALSEGNLPMPGDWSLDRCFIPADPWTQTDALYKYLLSIGWTALEVRLEDTSWFVSNLVPAGSAAFYEYPVPQKSGIIFEHAAITTGEFVTFSYKEPYPSASYEHVPVVVDQSNTFITGPHAVLFTSIQKRITILVPLGPIH